MGLTPSPFAPSSSSPLGAFVAISPLDNDGDNDGDNDDDDEDANMKIGTNVNRLRICLTRLKTDAIGGPSVLYIPRNVTLSVPYRHDTSSSNMRPRILFDVDDGNDDDDDDSLSSISTSIVAFLSPMRMSSTTSSSSFVVLPPRLPTTAHSDVDDVVIVERRWRSTVTEY